MKPSFKISSMICLVWVLFASSGNAFQLAVQNDRITIHADQVKLQTLMKDLAEKTGIAVSVEPGLNPDITADFNDKELQRALESILTPLCLSHALEWESTFEPEVPRTRLTEIHIFKQSGKYRMQPRKTDTPLDIARNPVDGSLYVRAEIMIRLKPGVDINGLNAILQQFGGTVVAENSALGIYRIKLPDRADVPTLVHQLRDLPGIEKAEPNYAYPIALPYRYRTGSEITAEVNIRPLSDGRVPIAVLDSGLSPGNLPGEYLLAALDAFNPDDPISDDLGHGTQMALVAAGLVTPFGAEKNTDSANPVIAIRTFDENGYTSSAALMNAIDFAMANGARVVSLSWGSDTRSDFMDDAFEYGASKGLVFVASAGNDATGKPVYPAAYGSVIGVGALAPNGQNWENSNYGDFVDAYLPGFANMPVGYKADPGIYAGTSISAAFAANQIAAFLSQTPGADPKAVLNAH